jgi:hypothetical protein
MSNNNEFRQAYDLANQSSKEITSLIIFLKNSDRKDLNSPEPGTWNQELGTFSLILTTHFLLFIIISG